MLEENKEFGTLVGVIHELDANGKSIERIAKAKSFLDVLNAGSLIFGLSPYVLGNYDFLWCEAYRDSPFVASSIGISLLGGIVSHLCSRRIRKRLRKITGMAKDAYADTLEQVITYQGGKIK